MPRSGERDEAPDRDDGEVVDDEPSGPPRSRARHRGRTPLREWDGDEPGARDPGDEEPVEEAQEVGKPGLFHRPKRPVYFRMRDSVYFEPLFALAIILILLGGLWAYTQNWPPVYVVESESMQHGYDDHVGLINTGDLVLAQKVDPSTITTYVVGAQTGYSTYGEFGDVVLYHQYGNADGTPIIHRALIWLDWNQGDQTYSAPTLSGLPCGSQSGAVYRLLGSPNGCGATHIRGTLELLHVGWQSVTVPITLDPAEIGDHSGFVTEGDNNFDATSTQTGQPDQPPLSTLVEPGWIVGVARGMIPWFGGLKLWVEGNAGEVPPQSWQYMGLTIVALIVGAFAVHFALKPKERDEEEPGEDDDGRSDNARSPPRGRRRPLRLWGGGGSDEGDEEAEETSRSSPAHSKSGRGEARGSGRPKPHVRRGHAEKDTDEEL